LQRALEVPARSQLHSFRRHPTQVEREADEAPLACHLAQPSQTECSEAEHALHPSEDGFDDRLSLAVAGTPRGTVKTGQLGSVPAALKVTHPPL
jgi:hypothetical protein